MQITNPNNITDTIIVTPQDTKSVSCELSNNGTLFDILSNSLYADKMLAVIREILCNAWDSHIVNNKSHIPLEVSLNDSTFVVKDFGSGIDPEKILQIYGTYGQSTKTDDEKQVGGFGIGSKAPFAYTDTFTVTNVYKNIKSVYILTKEPNQAPLIKTVYSGTTDEPAGLTVSVVLKKNHEDYFKNKLEKFMSKTDIKIKLNNVLYKNNDFSNTYCFIKSLGNHSINLYVKYNSVSYKVSLENIEGIDPAFCFLIQDTSNYFKFEELILNAEPNTLDISATREALSYTQKTKDTIKVLCNNFTKHITTLIENSIKDVYKDINTPKEYFEYINYVNEKYLNKNFIFNTTCISKDKEFIEYLVYWISSQNHFHKEQIYQKKLKNIVNFYKKILFSKIFNIKLIKLQRKDLIKSLIINLFPDLIYVNTWQNTNKKHISSVDFTKVPDKVYVITNKTAVINREQYNLQIPVLLTTLKNKDSLINKLTDFGFECVFVSAPKKEKNIINRSKDFIYAKLINDYTYRDTILEPNSYILYKSRELSAYDKYLRNYYYENFFNLSKKIYEVYYKNDFNLLLTQGHIDLDKEIESGKFIDNHFDIKFLNQTILYSVNLNTEYKFQNFIENFEKISELIKNKKWQTFFQKYKKNIVIIKFYSNYVKKNTNILKKIINVKNNLAFNNLLKSGDIKKIIDYKKINQYIIEKKIEPVIELLELIKE